MKSTWWFAWRLIDYRRWDFWLCFGFWTVFVVVPIATGLIIKAFFDGLSGAAPALVGPWGLLALLLAVEGTRIAMFYGSLGLWITFANTAEALLRANLLSWLVRGPGTRLLPSGPGEAVSRFRDDVTEVIRFIDSWFDTAGEAFFTVIALAIMIQINPWITLVIFLPMLGIIAVTRAMSERIRTYREQARATTGRVTGFIGELFGAIQAIKVSAAEERAVERFRRLNLARREAALRDRVFSELLESFNANVVNLGLGLVLLLAASSMRTGEFTLGDFALFVSYLTSLAALPRWVGRMMVYHRQAGVSLVRLAEVMEGTPAERLVEFNPTYLKSEPPPPAVPPHIAADGLARLEIEGLSYAHPSSGRGVAGVSFSIERGSFTVITGRIGAGKTTLLRVLLGLLPIDSGTVRWNGQPVADRAAFFTPPHSAYTPQVPRLCSDSLRDNIMSGLPADSFDLARAVHLAVLDRDVQVLDQGLDTLVGPRGVRLSGGQVQRAAAARMFVRAPELLVFDDLSSALDVETERVLWERMTGGGWWVVGGSPASSPPLTPSPSPSNGEGSPAPTTHHPPPITCLVVSNRRAVLQRADQVIVLKDGQVDVVGRLDELLKSSEEMQRLWAREV